MLYLAGFVFVFVKVQVSLVIIASGYAYVKYFDVKIAHFEKFLTHLVVKETTVTLLLQKKTLSLKQPYRFFNQV